MRQPTFLEGAVVALAASLTGSVLFSLFGPALPGALLLRILIAGMGLAYVIYLLSRSRERIGRVTAIATWTIAAGLIWLISPPIILYAAAHIALIWLIRSLYFYSGVLPALADLGLNGLSLAAAAWAIMHTSSVFLAIWCFFLIQALFVAIPANVHGRRDGTPGIPHTDDRFERAHRIAETAVRKLSNVR